MDNHSFVGDVNDVEVVVEPGFEKKNEGKKEKERRKGNCCVASLEKDNDKQGDGGEGEGEREGKEKDYGVFLDHAFDFFSGNNLKFPMGAFGAVFDGHALDVVGPTEFEDSEYSKN